MELEKKGVKSRDAKSKFKREVVVKNTELSVTRNNSMDSPVTIRMWEWLKCVVSMVLR